MGKIASAASAKHDANESGSGDYGPRLVPRAAFPLSGLLDPDENRPLGITVALAAHDFAAVAVARARGIPLDCGEVATAVRGNLHDPDVIVSAVQCPIVGHEIAWLW